MYQYAEKSSELFFPPQEGLWFKFVRLICVMVIFKVFLVQVEWWCTTKFATWFMQKEGYRNYCSLSN
jgi:hypothetical protein